VIIQLLSPERCAAILEELRDASGDAATVYGRGPRDAVHLLTRKATRVIPSHATRAEIEAALMAAKEQLSDHFGVALTTVEEPQFLRYQTGDYFVAHQDGNTPLLFDDTRHRRVSAIVFLSRPDDYSGGALVFHERTRRTAATCEQGTLLAFRSELTHEVMPLTAGERYTIATWYR